MATATLWEGKGKGEGGGRGKGREARFRSDICLTSLCLLPRSSRHRICELRLHVQSLFVSSCCQDDAIHCSTRAHLSLQNPFRSNVNPVWRSLSARSMSTALSMLSDQSMVSEPSTVSA